jgi:hypothetical protein
VLLDLAQRAEADTADLPDLQRLVRIGSSLGGARPEAHVRKADGRIAIAKFPSASHDTWNVMTWEKVALDLAVQAGIEVPSSMLLNLAGRSVLILDRFDRTAAGERVGYVSAMTKLEASDGDQRSYLDIAEVIERVSTSATEELHQLWRRIVFSIMISTPVTISGTTDFSTITTMFGGSQRLSISIRIPRPARSISVRRSMTPTTRPTWLWLWASRSCFVSVTSRRARFLTR